MTRTSMSRSVPLLLLIAVAVGTFLLAYGPNRGGREGRCANTRGPEATLPGTPDAAGLAVPAAHAGRGIATAAPVRREFVVSVLLGGRWYEAGRVACEKHYRTGSVAIPAVPGGAPVRIMLEKRGGGAAHLDSADLDGIAPAAVEAPSAAATGAGQERHDLAVRKLAARDDDVLDAAGRIVLEFPPRGTDGGATLRLTGRIEPDDLAEAPFVFPSRTSPGDRGDPDARYEYEIGSRRGRFAVDGMLDGSSDAEMGEPLFRVMTDPGTGHPSAYTTCWVRDDGKTLYAAMDVAMDNTRDGEKDYAAVRARPGRGEKTFYVREASREWGAAGFVYTYTAGYQHKVYEFAIPLAEIFPEGVPAEGTKLPLQFLVYGTGAPVGDYYVRPDGDDANPGDSWATAKKTIQAAIAATTAGNNVIFVAAGTYTPGTARSDTFLLMTGDSLGGVQLYGGFRGGELNLNGQDAAANPTILSGDIGTPGDYADNCYHVVTMYNWATLSGFTVTGGNANGSGLDSSGGGALISNVGGARIEVCTFAGNRASGAGGAVYYQGPLSTSPSSIIRSCRFLSNVSSGNAGGAIYCTETTFGGLSVNNCAFTGNAASSGGAVAFVNVTSSAEMLHCSFYGNSSSASGGAVIVTMGATPTIGGSIFWGNTASDGSQVYCGTGTNADISYCDWPSGGIIGTYTDNGGNINADPLFADPDGADNTAGTPDDDLRLLYGSPCIDAGADLGVSNDLLGISRPQGAGYDMGAYEGRVAIIYVDAKATGSNNGTSWLNAYTGLQPALLEAQSGTQIWVASGTYKPGSQRTDYFVIPSGVSLYGGFIGNGTGGYETQLAQRNWVANPAVLSGDIGTPGVQTDNSYHVVYGSHRTSLDGFTVRDGYADYGSYPGNTGGGFYVPPYRIVRVENCLFTGNTAALQGGAVHISYSQARIVNCIFLNNSAGEYGGAGYIDSPSRAFIRNCALHGNTARYGGGFLLANVPDVANCVFYGNSAENGGAVMTNSVLADLTNCTFHGNSASAVGGGIYSNYGQTRIRNCILWGNAAPTGQEIAADGSGVTVDVSWSDVHDGVSGGRVAQINGGAVSDGGGNIAADPLFVNAANPAGSDGRYLTADDGLAPASGSPVVDSGTAAGAPAADCRGIPRPYGAGVDMGAYETLPGLAIGPDSLPDALPGREYHAALTVSGGTPPYSFSISSGQLPPGIYLSAADGTISGSTAVADESFPFTVTATDSLGATGSKSLSITVGPYDKTN
ncbi:MAG: putative Ig domain-containing protein, partial [Planctomycetota bacterium]|nr:putative Ig domain-containing protein [Planctomycetota bacterium]